MSVNNPTQWYSWVLPVTGGSIGSWGTILNTMFSEDTGDTTTTPSLGIDETVWNLQGELDTLTTAIDTLQDRIVAEEASPATSIGARTERSSSQSIPKEVASPGTKVAFNSMIFDAGDLTLGDVTRLTVPVGGSGYWQLRASIKVPRSVGSGDDGRFWVLRIVKNGTEILADRREPYLDDDVDSSNSGDFTLGLSVTNLTAEADYFEAFVDQGFSAGGTDAATLAAGNGTFLEAVRVLV